MKKQLCVITAAALLCCGCGEKEKQEEVSVLEYTIVQEKELPEQLRSILEDKKSQPFRLTYEEEDVLYIAEGYGERQGGGYSIQIQEAVLGNNAIYFGTELIGPRKEEIMEGVKSYPYLVIKTGRSDVPVVFQ